MDMIIKDGDLYSKNTPIVQILDELKQQELNLRHEAERISTMDKYIVNAIQNHRITNMNEIYNIIHWLKHTDLKPIDILRALHIY